MITTITSGNFTREDMVMSPACETIRLDYPSNITVALDSIPTIDTGISFNDMSKVLNDLILRVHELEKLTIDADDNVEELSEITELL